VPALQPGVSVLNLLIPDRKKHLKKNKSVLNSSTHFSTPVTAGGLFENDFPALANESII